MGRHTVANKRPTAQKREKKEKQRKKNIKKEPMTNKGCSYLGSPPGVGGVRLDDPGCAVHRGHHHRIPVVVTQQLLDAAQHAALVNLQYNRETQGVIEHIDDKKNQPLKVPPTGRVGDP